jgi:hypothetical protein
MNMSSLLVTAGMLFAAGSAQAAQTRVDQTPSFIQNLQTHINRANAIVHDGIWKTATNQINGTGLIYEHYIDQKKHGALSIVVGENCGECDTVTSSYSNGDGTYQTITVYAVK